MRGLVSEVNFLLDSPALNIFYGERWMNYRNKGGLLANFFKD